MFSVAYLFRLEGSIMRNDDHSDYLTQRLSQERQAAANADHANVRQIHLDLARHYDERLVSLRGAPAATLPALS